MRLERIDILRGIALILMIFFHLNYSLVHIFDSEILNFSESFWYILGKISALSFIFLAGFSYFLAEQKYGKKVKYKYWNYALVLGLIAMSISGITFFFFPEQFISFGILHFFTLSFFLLPLIPKLKHLVFPLAGASILGGIYATPMIQSPYLFPFGFEYPGFLSADYYPLFPYFGVLLLGYGCGLLAQSYDFLKLFRIHRETHIWEKVLIYLGRRSLLIYLLHQPIIVGILFFIWKIK